MTIETSSSTLRQAREQAGMSQKDLAARSGVNQGYISNLELGRRRPPSEDIARKLSTALGQTLDEVFPSVYRPLRDDHGRFTGAPLPETMKQKISKGQQARHARNDSLFPPLTTGVKKCSACKRIKVYNIEDSSLSQFSIKSRNLADGRKRKYPAARCKTCEATRAAAYKAKLQQEGTYLQKQKEWNKNRNKTKRQRYQREYGAARRRQQGATPRGPWKKYRTTDKRVKLNAEPLLRWIEPLDVHLLTDEQRKALRRAKTTGQITDVTTDEILTRLKTPHAMATLYPPTDHS